MVLAGFVGGFGWFRVLVTTASMVFVPARAKGWFTRATQTQTQAQAQGSSHVQRKRKHSAIRKRNRVFQDGGRSRCIGVVVLSLSWSSSNKT